MTFLRSTLFMLWSMVITVIAGPIVILAALILRGLSGYKVVYVWRRCYMWGVEHILGIRTVIKGRENMPATPAVILAKHQSAWETVALQDCVPRGRYCAFVLKKELLMLPFFGWSLAAMGMISIDRKAGKEALNQVATQGRNCLHERGLYVIVFPEGTRTAPGEYRRYKPGGAHLASNANAVIVPIAHNAGELWPRNAFLKRPGTITVSIGQPIDTTGLSDQEITRRAEEWIEGEMRFLAPHRYADAQPAA